MAFAFPAAPEIGDAYASGGASYFWNGIIWERGTGLVKPFLTSLVPDEGPTNDPSIAVRVLGGNFKADSKVFWDASEMPTTFVSTSELNVTALSAPLASVANVTVAQDAGLMVSGPLEFTYIQPAPFISVLEPNVSPTNMATPVKIKGGNFTSNSIVIFDGVQITPTFVNAGELNVNCPVRTAAKAGVVIVVDGALASNNMNFNWLLQTMWLHRVVPNTMSGSAQDVMTQYIGEGFKAGQRTCCGPVDIANIFVSATEFQVRFFPYIMGPGVPPELVGPIPPGTVWYASVWDLNTGEVSNSLPVTFT